MHRPLCGYQAVNTLGRSLLEGADNVKLFGESIEVQAEICQLTGLSGHADREGLLKWVNSFEPKPKRVFIIHGEDEVENIFAQTLTEQGFNACAPYNGEQWAIGAEGAVCLKEGTRIRIEHHVSRVQPVRLPSSSACSMPASVCCESSSTTRAVPTRTSPSSPTRSTLSVTSGTDEANIPAA